MSVLIEVKFAPTPTPITNPAERSHQPLYATPVCPSLLMDINLFGNGQLVVSLPVSPWGAVTSPLIKPRPSNSYEF